jgi:hypothetical protein
LPQGILLKMKNGKREWNKALDVGWIHRNMDWIGLGRYILDLPILGLD